MERQLKLLGPQYDYLKSEGLNCHLGPQYDFLIFHAKNPRNPTETQSKRSGLVHHSDPKIIQPTDGL